MAGGRSRRTSARAWAGRRANRPRRSGNRGAPARSAMAMWPMPSAPARRIGLRFQPVERGRDLEPVGRQVLFRLRRGRAGLLAEPQHDHLHQAVAERLAAQRGRSAPAHRPGTAWARRAACRDTRRSRASCRARVPSSSTSVGILLSGFTAMTSAFGLFAADHHPLGVDAAGNPGLMRRHHHLAHERRPRRPEQLHGRTTLGAGQGTAALVRQRL